MLDKIRKQITLGFTLHGPYLKSTYSFKGQVPGINSSQSKNVGKIQLSMQLSHLSIIM